MIRLLFLFLLWPTTFSVGFSLPDGEGVRPLLVRAEWLFTGRGDDLAHGMDVLCRGGRIVEVGEGIQTPKNALVLEGPGLCVLPGLIDVHVRLDDGFERAPLYLFLAWGVTTVRDFENALPRINGLKEIIEKGEIFGPRILSSGESLTTQEKNAPFQFPVTDPDEARAAVDRLAKGGADFLFLSHPISPSHAEAAVKQARSLDVLCAADLLESTSWDALKAVEIGVHSLERLGGVPQAVCANGGLARSTYPRPLFQWLNRDLEKENALIQEIVKHGVYLVPTLAAFEAVTLPDKIVLAEGKGTQGLPGTARKYWREIRARRGYLPWWPASCLLHLRYSQAFLLSAHRAGARIAAGSGAPTPGVAPGFGLHRELELLVDAGLSPAKALCAATLDAARCIGAEKELGTIEPGKAADLLIVEGNPSQNIANTQRIKWVIKEGRLVKREEIPGFSEE
jgi:hypothetical protein